MLKIDEKIWAILNCYIALVIAGVWNNVKAVTSSVLNAVKSAVSTVFNSVVSSIRTAMRNVYSTIVSGFNQAVSFITGLAFCKRFLDKGMTPEQVAERMDVPMEFINACMR